ncbi:MAG: hypothetical protein V3R95_04520 [Dehalococcoidia bacterium]
MSPLALWGTLLRRLRDSTGQIAISFMLMAGVAGLAGVLTLDVGFWLAERREAQGDADAIALAAAFELPVFNEDLASGNQSEAAGFAIAAAEDWARANGVRLGGSDSYTDPDSELALEVVWNDGCFAGSTPAQTAYVGVTATVTRQAPSVFLRMLKGIGDLDALTRVSVAATACTGVPVEAVDFVPWVMSMGGDCFDAGGDPLYGQRCILVDDVQGAGSANIGQISIDPDETACPADGNNSASQYEDNIAAGVNFICGVGDSLSSSPGLSPQSTLDGIKARLAAFGTGEPCDAAFTAGQPLLDAGAAAFAAAGLAALPAQGVDDGIDDFFENWALPVGYDAAEPAADLELLDCDPGAGGVQSGPRNIPVFLIADLGSSDSAGCSNPGNNCYLIQGVAAIYLEACSSDGGLTVARDFDCDPPFGHLQIYGRLVSVIGNTALKLGFSEFGDWQTFLKD